MMNDSVREELKPRVSPIVKKPKPEMTPAPPPPGKPVAPVQHKPAPPVTPKPAPPVYVKPEYSTPTAEITSNPTIPTLVEFQPKNSAVPEWRLQLQNAVRQRMDNNQPDQEQEPAIELAPKPVLRTSGANALKAEAIAEVENVKHNNPKVQNALRRIEASRKRFLPDEKQPMTPVASDDRPKKDYPFYIAAKTEDTEFKPIENKPAADFSVKPKLVASLRNDTGDFDTNKLPPMPQPAKISTSFEKRPIVMLEEKPRSAPVETEMTIHTTMVDEEIVESEVFEEIEAIEEIEENEDIAPFTMRFNAGLFDLLIGSFASMLLLTPFVLVGGDWFTPAGVFAFLATTAIIMFVYLTASVGLFGRTFGMRIFSLELIDIAENDYPTLHQAAVNSSVYILSLAIGGLGFLTIPFNEDKRAVHDLVSGTMVVKEM